MDKSAGIARGRLTMTGAEVQRAFDPCVTTILNSIRSQMEGTGVKVCFFLLCPILTGSLTDQIL